MKKVKIQLIPRNTECWNDQDLIKNYVIREVVVEGDEQGMLDLFADLIERQAGGPKARELEPVSLLMTEMA